MHAHIWLVHFNWKNIGDELSTYNCKSFKKIYDKVTEDIFDMSSVIFF